MKRISLALLCLAVPGFVHAAPIFRTVQISSDTTFAPTLQTGAIKISSGTITRVSVSTIVFNNGVNMLVSPRGTNSLSMPDANTLFIGEGAGATAVSGSGVYNVITGPRAGGGLTTGSFSTAYGTDALGSTFTGQQVNVTGYAAGNALTSGSYDNCIGGSACLNTTTGSNITAVGTLACRDCNSDSEVALGHQAAQFHSSGSGGIDIGYQAGVGTTTLTNSDTQGAYSIHIGYQSGQSVSSSTVLNNCIAIGKQALCSTSNQAQIGGTNGTGNEVILRVSSATVQGTQLDIAGVTYRWPSSQASGTKILSNDGSGNLSWATDQTGAGSGYATIQDEGSGLTQRTTLNFTGGGVNCVDNSGSSRTDCTINAGSGGSSSLEVGLASTSSFRTSISSPTASLAFDRSQFSGQLLSGTTAFITIAYSTSSQTTNYLARSTDTVVATNCGSACTVTLPDASGISGKVYHVKMVGVGPVTLATTGSQTIDGVTTLTPNPNQNTNIEVISDGSNWLIL